MTTILIILFATFVLFIFSWIGLFRLMEFIGNLDIERKPTPKKLMFWGNYKAQLEATKRILKDANGVYYAQIMNSDNGLWFYIHESYHVASYSYPCVDENHAEKLIVDLDGRNRKILNRDVIEVVTHDYNGEKLAKEQAVYIKKVYDDIRLRRG